MPSNFTIPPCAPITERLEWATDLAISRGGQVYARSLRQQPRHTITFDFKAAHPGSLAAAHSLRASSEFKIPLWQHAVSNPNLPTVSAPAFDAGPAASEDFFFVDKFGEAEIHPAGTAWPEWAAYAAPVATARVSGDQRTLTSPAPGVLAGSVAFLLTNYLETQPATPHREYLNAPLTGVGAAAPVGALDYFTACGGGISEHNDTKSRESDSTFSAAYQFLYSKRHVTLSIVLRSRADILAFRALLFACKGRAAPLAWAAPQDTAAGVWLLASDTVELTYPRRDVATCTLSVMQLG